MIKTKQTLALDASPHTQEQQLCHRRVLDAQGMPIAAVRRGLVVRLDQSKVLGAGRNGGEEEATVWGI